jgi:fumarylpyruvate hydrolase
MSTVIPVWQIPTVPVEGEFARFPARRIYCVGRNYAAHTREMGGDPTREDPFFFMKPADAVVMDGATIPYPQATRNLHHEIELVVALKGGGKPWDMGKGFDRSAPITAIRSAARIGHPSKGAIWLKVNGKVKETSDLADLIWRVPATLSFLSGLVELAPGDLIYTGTPEGVGPVVAGDLLEGHVDGVGDLTIRYA